MKPGGRNSRVPRWQLAAIVGGIALLSAACNSGSSSTAAGAPSSSAPASASASPPSSALCADAAALRTALDKLTHIQPRGGQGAVNEIKADLTGVKKAATAFANDASGQWQTQTSSLKSSLASLQTAVSKLGANPSTTAVKAVVTAFGEVTTAAADLFAAVGKQCPSGA